MEDNLCKQHIDLVEKKIIDLLRDRIIYRSNNWNLPQANYVF